MKKSIFAIVLFVSTAMAHEIQALPKDEILVIVNKRNPASELGRDDLRPIFQTTKLQWPSGGRIAAYDLPDGDPIRDEFDMTVLGLDPDRVNRYWIDRRIRGGERPPAKLPSPSAVVHAVAANVDAIGYVDLKAASDTVKVVARIHDGQVFAP